MVNGSQFIVVPNRHYKDNTVIFKASKHIEIGSNFTSDSTTNLILTIDSCR